MDFSLRCNSLSCRKSLKDQALVTTCSHIFCVSCSESLPGLADLNTRTRECPACHTQLPNPDDAVFTQLNPTEDYKTSVLSGLSPTTIMECAGRALAFHSYQSTQEIIYQEHLAKSLTDKYSMLSSQLDQIINEANGEILRLRDKQTAMQAEQKALEQKNLELVDRYKEKAESQKQLQKLYTSLKQQQLSAGMELAAEHDAESVLQSHYHDSAHQNGQQMPSRAGSNAINGSGGRRIHTNQWQNQPQNVRPGLQSSRSAPIQATPSAHRTRLQPAGMYGNTGTNNAVGADNLRQGTPHRPVLGNIDPNVYGSYNGGYGGMSAGVKVGRQQNGPLYRSGRSGGVGLNIR